MIAKMTEPLLRHWTEDEFARLSELGIFAGEQVELRNGEIGVSSPTEGWQPRCWSKAEYYRLGDEGFFRCQKVELWEGEIVVMSPQGPLHYSTVDRIRKVLERLFGAAYGVRMQGPIDLGSHQEPEPDIAVVHAQADLYRTGHPQGAFLIVEVSDSSVSIDRGSKGSLYARAGIADYWVVNLVADQLEVYRNPQPDPTQVYGHRYFDAITLQRHETVSPLAVPHLHIPVAELLG
jgi:Uma2 family endonuclease